MSLCFRAYTQQQFVEAIASSRSLRQALLVLGVSPKESNYRAARRRIEKLNLDISHFCKSGPAYARGRQTPLEAYFDGTVKITSHLLRVRLLSDGIFDHRCMRCKRTKWQNVPIPLELNHIDGEHTNNALENLELLCPNCHALTPNYRGRNKKFRRTRLGSAQ